jgi:hypothetical protein
MFQQMFFKTGSDTHFVKLAVNFKMKAILPSAFRPMHRPEAVLLSEAYSVTVLSMTLNKQKMAPRHA